ncbi:MAG TPA: hypothetical protein DIT48_04830 [Actinobacteria bacterium]|jgi:hypothetical protein|nr:hypothetical protein [Actinomycetota bacterium]
MDVSTSIVHDPKFRQLHRERPEHVAPAFMAYLATLGESWRSGRRVSVTEAWPALLPFDADVVASMIRVRLVERGGLPPRKAWDGWYRPAFERRCKSRDRWARYNAKRDADTALEPRGSDVSTATSVPSVPFLPSVPTEPSSPSSGRAKNDDGPKAKDEDERRRALTRLSEDFQAGRLTELEYSRQRKALAS